MIVITGEFSVFWCKMEPQADRFNLTDQIRKFYERIGKRPEDGDILVLSGKYVAMSEGRRYPIGKVNPMRDAERLAKLNGGNPRLAEAVIRESESVYSSFSGIFMGENNGLLQPNAGIDKSNVQDGYFILYPEDPDASALSVRLSVLTDFNVNIGVVISDSRIYPARKGTVGIAIGYSGIRAILDERGKSDLFGNPLKITRRAVADQLATIAQLAMGESSESVPIVLIRGLQGLVLKKDIRVNLSVKFSEDIYYNAIKNIVSKTTK